VPVKRFDIIGEYEVPLDVQRRMMVNRVHAIRALMAGGDAVIYQPVSEHLKGNGGYVICNLKNGGTVNNVRPRLS
jgi:hypothetical protein